MQAFLLHHGIVCRAKYLPDGSMKHLWHLYGPGKWTPELTAALTALGFTDFDRKPLGRFSGNGGTFSVSVSGHLEFLTSDPVLNGPASTATFTTPLPVDPTNNDSDILAARPLIIEARSLWQKRCAEYYLAHGDRGSCVLGAGIAIRYLAPRCRSARSRIIIDSMEATSVQGSCVWEASTGEIIALLKPALASAYYCCGRMD